MSSYAEQPAERPVDQPVDPHADPALAGSGLPIKEASALLGVPAPTLRSWERRYGLPTTSRSAGGHRRYGTLELIQLRLMRDEIAIGRQAGAAARWVGGILDQGRPGVERVHALLDASNQLSAGSVRAVLELAQAEIGLAATLDEVVMPAMRQIGLWWETGACDVGQERLTTEVLRGWLAKIVTLSPAPGVGSRTVLLATGPDDFHTLGLEALAALLAQAGVGSRSLGAHTPLDLLLAAAAATPDAVVVIVSHLPSQRRSAVASIEAVAQAGIPVFYAGNALLFPTSRRRVPGTYLGSSLGAAAALVAESSCGPG